MPSGYGETISQPFIVALMTDLLDLQPTNIVLEVGTGLGYQTAILASLACHVYSVRRPPESSATWNDRHVPDPRRTASSRSMHAGSL